MVGQDVRLGAPLRQEDVGAAGFLQLGQPEVEQLGACPGDHDVRGLDVAVQGAVPVRAVERIGQLAGVAKHLIDRQGAPFEARRQRLALDVLHHQEVGPVLFAHVVEDADVGVAQGGDGAGLTLESLSHVRPVGQMRRQHLDGDDPVQARVTGLVDLAHPTRAHLRQDLVRTPVRSGLECHGSLASARRRA